MLRDELSQQGTAKQQVAQRADGRRVRATASGKVILSVTQCQQEVVISG